MKKHREAHSMNKKFGMGSFSGTGIRAKTGKLRDMFAINGNPPKPKALRKPPKTLA